MMTGLSSGRRTRKTKFLAMRRIMFYILLFLCVLSLREILIAEDCALQNIFFPLGEGFTWTYTGVSNGLSISSKVTCTMSRTSPFSGQLLEEFTGFPTPLTHTTLIKVEKGAVYSTEPTKRMQAQNLGLSGSVSDTSGQFQLYLPAMDQVAQGVAWSRTGHHLYSTDTPLGAAAVKGTYQQDNMAHVIGTERISAAGTFTALKVQASYDIQAPGYRASYVFIRWYAPAVGLVKEMTADGTTVKELTAFQVTPCCGFVVLSADGNARINDRPAASGMGGAKEAHLAVPAGSSMTLALGDGSLLKLSNGVDAQMSVLCPNTAQEKTTIDIIRGAIRATIIETLTPSPKMEIRTPTCAVGVRGTEFDLEVKEEAGRVQTIVHVLSGTVSVRPKGADQDVILQAGARQIF
ncbi:MAG: FecR family protein [Clostridiales bacterium]|nr:FecR family protein [Clostridiales bacterium]